jgi:hypothetical protein
VAVEAPRLLGVAGHVAEPPVGVVVELVDVVSVVGNAVDCVIGALVVGITADDDGPVPGRHWL